MFQRLRVLSRTLLSSQCRLPTKARRSAPWRQTPLLSPPLSLYPSIVMACSTLSNSLASISSSAGRISTTTNLPAAKTVCGFVRPSRAVVALASANGVQIQQGGEAPKGREGIQQRRPRDTGSLLLLDSWDPFSRGGLTQMMNIMDRLFLDDTRASGARGGASRAASSGIRAPWDVAEDEEAFHIRVDMPGFSKEDVKVAVEDGVLAVLGQRDPSKEDSRWAAKSYSKFNTRLALPDNVHLDKISAELKNGVLFVVVPKLKPEERKQVFDVQIS